MVNKLISKIKNTMTKNKNLYPLEDNEFMFSTKEIEDITEQNKQKLEKAKKMLEDAGYIVKRTGSTSSISKTIITNKKDVSDSNLKDLKEVLGVGSITTNKQSYSNVDVNIIIGKDFK